MLSDGFMHSLFDFFSQEFKQKLARVTQVRKELKSHIQSLPDLSLLPNVTGGLAPLPSAGDLFSTDWTSVKRWPSETQSPSKIWDFRNIRTKSGARFWCHQPNALFWWFSCKSETSTPSNSSVNLNEMWFRVWKFSFWSCCEKGKAFALCYVSRYLVLWLPWITLRLWFLKRLNVRIKF